MGIHRVLALVLMLAAACTAEVAAPRGTAPSPSASESSEAAHDVLYVRQAGNGSPTYITRIDAATGGVLGALPDGVVSADRATLYRAEPMNGARQTRLHEIVVPTGEERRAFTIDGDFALSVSDDGPAGLSADGRWLVLSRRAGKLNNEWVSGFAVVDIASGAVVGRSEFKGSSLYFVQAIAPDGASLLVSQGGDGATRLRIWDVAAGAFLPDDALGGWDGRQQGFTTAFAASRDARRRYWLDTANGGEGPFVRTLDLVTHRVTQVALPPAQRSSDFEKYMLWSLGLSPDGTRLYAVNPALGYADELDALGMTLRRTQQIPVSGTSAGPLDRLAQLFFPVAEAKRYLRGGALLSPDGRTLYAAGTKGIAVIDTGTLAVTSLWASALQFSTFTLTLDGARLYGIDDLTGKIHGFRTSDGAQLGTFRPALYASTIVRIDNAGTNPSLAPAPPAPCGAYAPPDPTVSAEIQHLKTSATVIEVTSPCTVRVRIFGGGGTLGAFTDRTIILRATSATTFTSATRGDLGAIAAFGLRPNDTFTLSFDSRAFPDGSYPLNVMDR